MAALSACSQPEPTLKDMKHPPAGNVQFLPMGKRTALPPRTTDEKMIQSLDVPNPLDTQIENLTAEEFKSEKEQSEKIQVKPPEGYRQIQ